MDGDYSDIFAALFADRNASCADIIEAELARSASDFIAVGLGHLVGPESVQPMLIERGYTVRRISVVGAG